MTGESLPVVLVDRLRAALDVIEQVAKDAEQYSDGSGVWRVGQGGGLASGSYLLLSPYSAQSLGSRALEHISIHDPATVLRTIQAHRALLERYDTAIVARDAAEGTLLAGATRMSLRIHEENVRLVASIYFPESDAT